MPDPVIDPTTGQPTNTDATPPSVTISKDEWDSVKQRLDAFEQTAFTQTPTSSPAPPSGPSLDEQLGEIDKQIDAFDAQIDDAVSSGKPVSKLLRERDALNARRMRLQIKHEDLDPALSAGISSINNLTDEITRGKMTWLKLPAVKKAFETTLSQLTPEQRLNIEARNAAYDMAVGKNLSVIQDAMKEEMLRSAADDQTATPGNHNGRSGAQSGGDDIPKPRDVLSSSALAAIKTKGMTVDAYYQKLGYTDWADFWEKRGKNYFSDSEEE